MQIVKIEKDIPITTRAKSAWNILPIEALEPKDSFAFSKEGYPPQVMNNLRVYLDNTGKKLNRKFLARVETNNRIRVWRIS